MVPKFKQFISGMSQLVCYHCFMKYLLVSQISEKFMVEHSTLQLFIPLYMFFGVFPGIRLCFADVLEPSVRSIFKGWIWNMKCEWWEESVVFIYTVSGFARVGRATGGGRHQDLGGSEWMVRCWGAGGGRYKSSLSGGDQVIVYSSFVPFLFQCM
jgi:hypothetical protein